MSQFERDQANARFAERQKAAQEKREQRKPVVVARPQLGKLAGGTTSSPEVELARQNMIAGRQSDQQDVARESRMSAVAQDVDTVKALVTQWIAQTSGFVPTEFNKTSLTNAVQEYIYNHGALSIAALDKIFEYLLAMNHLERSGHARVRGQGGVMVGRPTIYREFRSPAEQALDAQVQVRSSAQQPADNISVAEARSMDLSELGARVHAMRNGGSQQQAPAANISEQDAKDMPLSELRKVVAQQIAAKGRR